jgi:hypothetical protein
MQSDRCFAPIVRTADAKPVRNTGWVGPYDAAVGHAVCETSEQERSRARSCPNDRKNSPILTQASREDLMFSVLSQRVLHIELKFV